VLCLNAAESFLETSQCTPEHNSVEMQKNLDYEMLKVQILSGMAKSRIKKSG